MWLRLGKKEGVLRKVASKHEQYALRHSLSSPRCLAFCFNLLNRTAGAVSCLRSVSAHSAAFMASCQRALVM